MMARGDVARSVRVMTGENERMMLCESCFDERCWCLRWKGGSTERVWFIYQIARHYCATNIPHTQLARNTWSVLELLQLRFFPFTFEISHDFLYFPCKCTLLRIPCILLCLHAITVFVFVYCRVVVLYIQWGYLTIRSVFIWEIKVPVITRQRQP